MATVARVARFRRTQISPCPLCGSPVGTVEMQPGFMIHREFGGTIMVEGGDQMPSTTYADTVESWPDGNRTALGPCGHVFRGTDLTMISTGSRVELSCPDALREAYDRTLKITRGDN